MDSEDQNLPLTTEQKASSKLHDPTPQRKKHTTDLLYRFFTDQISYAELTGYPQKELLRLAEIGHIKLKHGRVDESLKIFEALVNIDNKNPFYHTCLGSVFQKKNRFIDAVHEYSEALKIKEDDLPSLVNRGEIYLKHRNFKKAAEDFRSAILLDANAKDMYANRARSLVIAIKRSMQLQKPKAVAGRPVRPGMRGRRAAPRLGRGRRTPS